MVAMVAELIEAFDQHAFRIEVCEAQRALYVSHSTFFSPFFYRVDQGIGYFRVVNKVDPAETDILLFQASLALWLIMAATRPTILLSW